MPVKARSIAQVFDGFVIKRDGDQCWAWRGHLDRWGYDRRAGTHPFVERCLERSRIKCALLMPSNWIQGDKRSRWLEKTPLYRVYFISPRPSMPPGPALEAGMKPGNGTTDYAWFVWLHGYDGRSTNHWLRRAP